jgi:hypothetical protein
MTLTTAGLLKAVQEKSGCTRERSEGVFDSILSMVQKNLAAGEYVMASRKERWTF